MEKRIEPELEFLTFNQLIQLMKIYFNMKMGTEFFVKKIIENIDKKLQDQYL